MEYLPCKLLPNCVQFHNAVKTSRSSICPTSNEVGLNFCFSKDYVSVDGFFSQREIVRIGFPQAFTSSFSNLHKRL